MKNENKNLEHYAGEHADCNTEKYADGNKDPYGVDLSKSYIDACSANDCTGLIPSLPQSKAEIESYEELYHFLPKNS